MYTRCYRSRSTKAKGTEIRAKRTLITAAHVPVPVSESHDRTTAGNTTNRATCTSIGKKDSREEDIGVRVCEAYGIMNDCAVPETLMYSCIAYKDSQ